VGDAGAQTWQPAGRSRQPVCDRTHSDQCLQLGQNEPIDRQLFKAYPRCEKVKRKLDRGTCIDDAGGVTSQ
jgi:hypothetical protein